MDAADTEEIAVAVTAVIEDEVAIETVMIAIAKIGACSFDASTRIITTIIPHR